MQTRHNQPASGARPPARPQARNVPETSAERRVEIAFRAPLARSVSVAGTFNNWNPKQTPLLHDSGGSWKATLSLRPGRYAYRFFVDGQWVSDPNAKESVSNPFGGTNSVLAI